MAYCRFASGQRRIPTEAGGRSCLRSRYCFFHITEQETHSDIENKTLIGSELIEAKFISIAVLQEIYQQELAMLTCDLSKPKQVGYALTSAS
jgi:hypothetical protein